jgi:protein-L-isoaspartate(D-aspartate) O-methyltransferase
MDIQAARFAMVESQIRPNGVRDPNILNAFAAIPRELFVPHELKPLAYIDEALPVVTGKSGGAGRYLLPPMTLAKLLQCSDAADARRVLDIGGVTGYSAAILSQLGGKVFALEASADLAGQSEKCLKEARIEGVRVAAGPLNQGLKAEQPYDLILVNGAMAAEPHPLFDQLAEGGRLAGIIRTGWQGQAYLFEKAGGVVSGRAVFDASAEYLPGFEEKPHFVF